MAFRRLKFADYLAVKGALAWKPHLFNPKHITDPTICRWGFVPQASVKSVSWPADLPFSCLATLSAGSV